MLRINNINIQGIGPIKHLELQFDKHFNIICGSNGIGKTTILDCIAETFSGSGYKVRKNTNSATGNWTTTFLDDELHEEKRKSITIRNERPSEDDSGNYWDYTNESEKILYYRTERSISYQSLQSISRDPKYDEHSFRQQLINGTNYNEIKQWFVNRYVWSFAPDNLTEQERYNLDIAKESFSFMGEGFRFDKVEHETNDIIIDTPKGKIVFEQLSTGFISFAIVLLGLIKDIEYRFKEPHIRISEFDGVLIIDELDVHLHPELQARIYMALDKMFPMAQIFTSTHSPHIIQVAKPNEVIPLVTGDDGNVMVNPIVNKEYGCQGWTIEEILTDVMGMKDTRSEQYKKLSKEFTEALDRNDMDTAKEKYSILDKMLHPKNILREVMKVQLV